MSTIENGVALLLLARLSLFSISIYIYIRFITCTVVHSSGFIIVPLAIHQKTKLSLFK